MIYFMAVTDDRLEFPVIIADSQAELARGLGVTDSVVCNGFRRSRTGIIRGKGKNRGIKYFRMDSRTGKVMRRETQERRRDRHE